MSFIAALALIVGTWVIAACLVPLAPPESFWPLPVILAIGCSGSIVAVVLA